MCIFIDFNHIATDSIIQTKQLDPSQSLFIYVPQFRYQFSGSLMSFENQTKLSNSRWGFTKSINKFFNISRSLYSYDLCINPSVCECVYIYIYIYIYIKQDHPIVIAYRS